VVSPLKGVSQLDFVDKKRLNEKCGLTPSEYRDYAAIVGEVADNLIGAKGIGPKTAISLIKQYKTLENIYNNLDFLTAKTKSSLLEAKERVFQNKRLNKLITNVDLPEYFCELNAIDTDKFDNFFDSLNFKTLPARLIKTGIFNFGKKLTLF
jgi:DNA polymerase-1